MLIIVKHIEDCLVAGCSSPVKIGECRWLVEVDSDWLGFVNVLIRRGRVEIVTDSAYKA